MSDPRLLEFEWQLPAGVRAAFTTRLGGVSEAPWDSFNVGAHVGDSPAAVAANRARLSTLLNLPAKPAWLSQVHGIAVHDLDGAPAAVQPPTADAVVTRERGRVCVIMVADCMPVLLSMRDGSRIAAAHAGWRGLASGVLEQTVHALGSSGGELTAWLGPAISREHFEVGDEVRAAFVAADAGAASMRSRSMRSGAGRRIWSSLAKRRLRVTRGHRCQRRRVVHVRGSCAVLLASARWEGRTDGGADLARVILREVTS